MKKRKVIIPLLLLIVVALVAYFYYTPPFPVTPEQIRAKEICDARARGDKLNGLILGASVDCRTLQIRSIGPNPF